MPTPKKPTTTTTTTSTPTTITTTTTVKPTPASPTPLEQLAPTNILPGVRKFIGKGMKVTSATKDSNGVVKESAATLAKYASDLIGRTITPEVYALARMIRSEAGGNPEIERMSVAFVALNDAKALKWDLVKLLTYHKDSKRANKFGPQITGRYATTEDPYEIDLETAENVLSGKYPDPTFGATKFAHIKSFGKQAGTGTYEATLAKWTKDGYNVDSVPGSSSDFVIFRKYA